METIKALASVFARISDIAAVLEIQAEELRADIADKSTEVSKVYRSAKISAKIILLNQEMKLAQIGSPLAIENANRNLMDMEDDE